MSVSKRLRFEILRRDEHTCQYCGQKAPSVTLQIDHVIPVALGGDDKPTNLVTACRDCNSGKSAVPPDAPLVASLSAQAAAYALGMVDKMTRFRADIESLDEYEEEFREEWNGWGIGSGENRVGVPLPLDYRMTLFRWKQAGIPASVLALAIPSAMSRTYVNTEDKFTYFAGIVWNMLKEREIDQSVTVDTAAVYTESEADDLKFEAWDTGYRTGRSRGLSDAQMNAHAKDALAHHIDRTVMVTEVDPVTGLEFMTGGVRRAA